MSEKKILNIGASRDDMLGNYYLNKYPEDPKIKPYDADSDSIPYPDNFFDEVYMASVLEHLRNTKLCLEESYRVLKPGGNITIITDQSLFFSFGGVHNGKYVPPMAHGADDMHFAIFTKHHLENHLKRAGFKDITVKQFSNVWQFKLAEWFYPKAAPHLLAKGYK